MGIGLWKSSICFNGLYGLRGCDLLGRSPLPGRGFNGLYGLRGCDLWNMISVGSWFQRPLWPEGLRLSFIVVVLAILFQRPLWPEGLRPNNCRLGGAVRFNGLYGLRGCDLFFKILAQAALFQRPLWPEGLRHARKEAKRETGFQRPLWPEGLRHTL